MSAVAAVPTGGWSKGSSGETEAARAMSQAREAADSARVVVRSAQILNMS